MSGLDNLKNDVAKDNVDNFATSMHVFSVVSAFLSFPNNPFAL